MSLPDQCPSTIGRTHDDDARGGMTPGRLWRSAEEFAQTPEFDALLAREFPAGASELAKDSRRDFIKLMGASLALAGAATIPGCRRPDHEIHAYSKTVPEEIIPGKALYYATSMPLPGGGAEGLLVETHEGRPTKIEGNPLHPNNQGRSSVCAQASVLGVYDPDRLKYPVYRKSSGEHVEATWDDFLVSLQGMGQFQRFDDNGGRMLAFLVNKSSGPSRDAMRDLVMQRWPNAMWLAYEPTDFDAALDGSRLAFGSPMREVLDLSVAKVIVTLDRDPTDGEGGALANARGVAAGRRVMSTHDDMSRIYAVESSFTGIGSLADHRLQLAPSGVSAFAVALARALFDLEPGLPGISQVHSALSASEESGHHVDGVFVEAVAEDLLAHRGHAVVLAGKSQPAEIHALTHVINAALGAVPNVVGYLPLEGDASSSSRANIRALAAQIDAQQVHTLVCINTNPVYDAPADLNFADRFDRVPLTVTLSVDQTETSARSVWSLNAAHYLESWGDTVGNDGSVAPIQPVIAPIYAPAMSEIEFLATLAGDGAADGHAIVRDVWRKKGWLSGDVDKAWRRVLHNGLGRPGPGVGSGRVDVGAVAGALARFRPASPPTQGDLEVVFTTGHVHDGRFANYGWLQELPSRGAMTVWDNPALVSPKTAEALGLTPDPYTTRMPEGKLAKLSVGGRSMELPVWILPGLADNTVLVHLGYGRTACGHVGTGVGFDTYALRGVETGPVVSGGTLTRTSGGHVIASTQNHWSLEDRTTIVRTVDLAAWKRFGNERPEPETDKYGNVKELNFAEKLGEMSHTPPNISLYTNPLNAGPGDPDPATKDKHGRVPAYTVSPQWGMSIDLSTCTGCGTCTVACQSENNIPIVGKKETAKGREMTWIRVDRYFTGHDLNAPERMLFQPVSCHQCENAPCETVCPVNATVHDNNGLNAMAYNRCIGTRYCANNCPYKVRRFNFFDYSPAKHNGGYIGQDLMPGGGPENQNLIPPRLRAKIDEISKMRMNPDVTVRSRGVMEKCTYCLQRLNEAKQESKIQGLDGIPDGFVQVACQQACPTGSIVFGDILDTASQVRAMRDHQRSYMMLGYLNTRPRTTYMIGVSNPNPALRAPVDNPFHHGGHGDEGHGGGHDTGSHGANEDAAHTFFDRNRSREDAGYAVSLRVMSSGVHA